MHIKNYDEQDYLNELDELKQRRIAPKNGIIIASDISEDAVNIAKINAGIAGVEHLIRFEQCDFAKTTVPDQNKGAVFFNPEYGDRLGAEVELQAVYKRMGDFMKQKCKGYLGYIFTGNLELAKKNRFKALTPYRVFQRKN